MRSPPSTAVLAALLFAAPAAAAPALHPLFSDGAVLQRDRPIAVRGTAEPGERLTVTLGSATRTVTAARDGAWRVALPAMGAGGPYQLTVAGRGGASARARDILIGDVWLCSGQSNMEWPVRRGLNGESEVANAGDPQLRLLTVPKKTELTPARGFGGPLAWSAASPQSVADFSAACYFMARDLRASQKVPIGAINASWGGTAIRAWMDEASAQAFSGDDPELLALYRRDPAAANRRFGARWQDWWRARVGSEPWKDASGLAWKPVPRIGYWEGWDEPTLVGFNGMVWARRTLNLTAAEAARGGTLSLGVLDDMDQTWVNGRPIANTFGWDVQRDYKLPAGALRPGANEILVNIFDSWGNGGFQGPAERVRFTAADGAVKPLGAGWEYAVVPPGVGDPPRPPWDGVAGLSLIHNGMVAPLGDFGLKGVAWYQGESDVSNAAAYGGKLNAFMTGWRKQFDSPRLPFLLVSLANFGPHATAPRQSGWAELREQQRLAAARDPDAALVVAMDLGERLDIHPTNKQGVGLRLARAARARAYGTGVVGPEVRAARRTADGIVLDFAGVTGGLQTWNGTRALAFELCGATQDSCRYADAVARGSTVRLADDGRPATRVRYAWSESPVVNLYDEAQLPVGPFEVPIAP